MYADLVLRLLFYAYRGNMQEAVHVLEPFTKRTQFMWDSWIDAVGYPPSDPEYHTVLIGPEWVGLVDIY